MRNSILTILMSVSFWVCGAAQAFAQNCTVSLTSLNFGSIVTLSSGNTDVKGTITLSCPGLVLSNFSAVVSADIGTGGSSGTVRQMANGSSRLNYQLYRDSARTSVFSSIGSPLGGGPIGESWGSLLFGSSVDIPFYGRVFGNQSGVSSGSYASYVVFRVDYRNCVLFCNDVTTFLILDVVAYVSKQCSVSASDINFGSRGALATNVNANGRLDVLCTPGTDFAISLSNGQNGTSANDRKMRSPAGGTVDYNLYRTPDYTAVWGSSLSTDTLSGSGSGTTDAYTVFGRVPAQPTPAAGVYTDTIIVTLTY